MWAVNTKTHYSSNFTQRLESWMDIKFGAQGRPRSSQAWLSLKRAFRTCLQQGRRTFQAPGLSFTSHIRARYLYSRLLTKLELEPLKPGRAGPMNLAYPCR